MKPDPQGLRLTSWHALPTTVILTCQLGEEVVGTVSIIRDNFMGLPLEHHFDLSQTKFNGITMAEISSLAIKKEYRKSGGEIFFPLVRYFSKFAESYMGIDCIAIGVHPKFENLYTDIFLCEKTSEQVIERYDLLDGNAPLSGYTLNFKDKSYKYAMIYGLKENEKNLFQYVIPNQQITLTLAGQFEYPESPYPQITFPFMTQELFEYFFYHRTQKIKDLKDIEIKVLKNYFTLDSCSLNRIKNNFQERTFPHHDTKLRARLRLSREKEVYVDVENVSRDGMRIHCKNLLPTTPIPISVSIKEFEVANLVGVFGTLKLRALAL